MNMKKILRRAVVAAAACVSLAVQAGTTAIAYQGVLRDAKGGVLDKRQQTVEFRLYDTAGGDAKTALWGRSVAVLMDTNGLFNVSLEDSNGAILADTKYTNLVEAVHAARVGGLFVGLNVVGSTGEITPRQRLLTVPYASFAHDVEEASGDFTVAGRTTLASLTVSGTAKLAAVEFDGTATFAQPAQFNGGITVGASGTISGNGTIPLGGIIMWSGSKIPDGWALCDGKNGTPDLTDRFVLGAALADVGKTGGSAEVTLKAENLPAHRHMYSGDYLMRKSDGEDLSDPSYTTAPFSETILVGKNGGYSGGINLKTVTYFYKYYTSAAGDGKAFDAKPPYYKLAFIMRVK